jgi:prepilin-type N-terminal cleavage/methylation domain-containing protein
VREAERAAASGGFTLVEMLVVLVLIGLAAALAAPALRQSRPERPPLSRLIPAAREAAARRGEVVQLRIAASGDWRLDGAASSAPEPIASGRVDAFPGLPLTLVVSPIGSCAFDARSRAAARAMPLDPLACEVIGR